MELTLPPEIPITRVVNGHNVFNKGYHHGMKGKTYEEYYGEELAKQMKITKSEKLKGHRFWGNAKAASKIVIAIKNGTIIARYESAKEASKYAGVSYATLRDYIKGRCNPKNGIKWFYEKDNNWYEELQF